MQRRIAIFLPSLVGGGAEKSMVRLANGLACRGVGVDLVLAKASGPYLPLVSRDVRIVDLQAWRVLSSLPALARYLRLERPDTMLSSLDYANIISLWARRLAGNPRRVVVNEQNTISITARQSRQLRQRLMPRLIKRFYPWADCIVGNSQGVVNDLRGIIGLADASITPIPDTYNPDAHIPAETTAELSQEHLPAPPITGVPHARIEMVYNPIVTPELQEMVNACLDHPWLEPGQPPVLLAVGRLTAQKDFPTLIQALAQVRQSRPVRLMILGEGPDRQALEALVEELNLSEHVSLPGFVGNPYPYMARASVFILSSRWEGLPTVLIEALFCGVPVVATDCPSGPREILASGKYGALVPVQDVTALAETISLALDGNTPRPCKESWRPYVQENVVDQYLRILLEDERCVP